MMARVRLVGLSAELVGELVRMDVVARFERQWTDDRPKGRFTYAVELVPLDPPALARVSALLSKFETRA